MTQAEANAYFWALGFVTLAIAFVSLFLWCSKSRRNNLDFGQPQTRLHAWKLTWVDFGIFLFAVFMAVFISQSLASIWLPDVPDSDESQGLDPLSAIVSILTLQCPILITYFAFQKYYASDYALKLNLSLRHWLEDLKESFWTFLQYLPIIWLCSLLWTLFLSLLQKLSIIGEFPVQAIIELLANDLPLSQMVLFAAFAIILAPLVEEILFRACLYRFLKGKTSLIAAQWISALAFALVHANLAAFLPLVLIGFILVRIYESTGSIYQAIFFHAFFNANSFLFLSLAKLSAIPIE